MNTKTSFASNTRWKVLSKSKSFKNYSYLTFSFIAIIIFALFAIRPTVKTILTLENTINQKKQTLAKLEDKNKTLQQAISNFNAISDDSKIKLYTLLPDSTNLPCFLDFISTLPSKTQVGILGIQIQQFDLQGVSNCTPSSSDLEQFRKNTVTKTSLSEITYTFNSTGAYKDLSTAIDALTHANRLTTIQNVVLSKPAESAIIMTINGKIFFYK